jgi:tryptophanyl-tRNA synthetase
MDTRRKQVLSCTQPTGNLHLGRYFGAVRQWVDLQKDYDCVYGIVDYHAMTMPFVPNKLRESTWNLAIGLAAVGIDPDNIFIQSMIPEHAELGWIFQCVSSYGELGRMVQFKEKSQQVSEKDKDAFISTGLFTYPVLQAADILIYRADYVPVGNDQDQHLELTRNIAQRFNNIVGKDYFVLPETLHSDTPRIMSTADPTMKMSASKGEKHNVDVFSDADKIRKQIRSAVTDMGEKDLNTMSPGVENLFRILKACGDSDAHAQLTAAYQSGQLKYVDLKEAVANAVVSLTDPFRAKRAEISADKRAFKDRIKASSEIIQAKARNTIREVKELIGLMQSATR